MSTYRLVVSYEGTRFAGWQRQPNADTVQEQLESALAAVTSTRARVFGAGRTDAGVHARGQVAHLRDVEATCRSLVLGTNHYLPEEIRVLEAARISESFHALRSAQGKEYRYRLGLGRVVDALDRRFVVPLDQRIEVSAMVAAAPLLEGRHDFSAFALQGGGHTTTERRIFSSRFVVTTSELVLCIVGEGFLRGMVRRIVGTLLEVGRGRLQCSELEALLKGGGRGAAGPTAPAAGLVLWRVFYGAEWRPEELYRGCAEGCDSLPGTLRDRAET